MELPEIPTTEEGDRFQLAMAFLIAIVTLTGAIIAWRASVAADNAGDADFAALQAVLAAEETLTVNDINQLRHYRAYTLYSEQQSLQQRMEALDDPLAATQAANLAAANQLFFPNRYLNRDGSYDVERQAGELWAQAAQVNDLQPAPHFAEATQLRQRSARLVAVFMVLTLSLLCYTFAEGIHPARQRLRFSLGGLGTVLLLVTIILTLLIERGGT